MNKTPDTRPCGARYGTGLEHPYREATCRRPEGHPGYAEDGIGHSPHSTTRHDATDSALKYKIDLITWLLSFAGSEGMGHRTYDALSHLASRGIDYHESDEPMFQQAVVDYGDSFNEATFARAYAATIRTMDGQSYEFHVPRDDMEEMLLSAVIKGVVTAADLGERAWRDRLKDRMASPVESFLPR